MFDQFNLNTRILKALVKRSYKQPTKVQQISIPHIIRGKDLFVIAPTGTGKTAAFILPLIHNLLAQGKPGIGLQALIVLPTRELANQIFTEFEEFNKYTFFKACLVTGGEEPKQQAARIRKNPDIIIGTLGRLSIHLKNHQITLENLQCVVLDEVDRTLDMGFGDDVIRLLKNSPANKQTLFFSATAGTKNLQQLAKSLLINPLIINLNRDNQPNKNIIQQSIFVENNTHKNKLIRWLVTHEFYKQMIIFTNTKAQAELLSEIFTESRIKHAVLHNDRPAKERKQSLQRLNQQHVNILIATDLVARGLDIKNVDIIINYNLPNDIEEYVHRIGRTGRFNNTGLAISLIDATDKPKLVKIEKLLIQPLIERVINGLKRKGQDKTNYSKNKKRVSETNKLHINSKTIANKKTIQMKKDSIPLISADGLAPLKRKIAFSHKFTTN